MTAGLLAAGAAAAAVLAIVTLAGVLWRKLGRHLAAFLRDWFGEPPRPGLPGGRPGVPERLAIMERRIETVEAELSPNHGHSVKDRVEKLARQAGVGS